MASPSVGVGTPRKIVPSTRKINASGGRHHWPKVFSVMLAGGGLKKGMNYGSSDALGAEPVTDPLTGCYNRRFFDYFGIRL